MIKETNPRTIRSFVKREGRMTKAQKQALQELFPIYGLSTDQGILDFNDIFKSNQKIILEIGFGMGKSLIEMAQANPNDNFIGIEVHRPGVGAILRDIKLNNLNNIRVFNDDAVEVLQKNIPDNSLARVQIFFPDPWHKKRHHKRRLIQSDFVQLIKKKLKNKGILHIATDWQDYAEEILELISKDTEFHNLAGAEKFSARPNWRPLTKFEKRGQKLNHKIFDLMFAKNLVEAAGIEPEIY
jgi:tRNA (guanine-N7-)-methyltransferase